MNNNKLLYCGEDNFIKLWTLAKKNIKLIKEMKENVSIMNKVIPLNERFASCGIIKLKYGKMIKHMNF